MVRRGRLLITALATAAALAVLAGQLHAHWLYLVSALVAVAGWIALLTFQCQQLLLEKQRERIGLDRRSRVPVGNISAVCATDIGVDPAVQTILAGNTIPQYLPRDVDPELQAAMEAGFEESAECWIVIAVGGPGIGKSRANLEAIRRCGAGVSIDVLAPVDMESLESLMTPGEMPYFHAERRVLWLDDIEPFLSQGLTLHTFRIWRRLNPRGIVVATAGGKGHDAVAGMAAIGALVTTGQEIIRHAHRIPMSATTAAELAPLCATLVPSQLTTIERYGLAAYLVAAPALEDKLVTGIHPGDRERCSEGAAIARAAVDWARCGRIDPIPEATLRGLWSSYLPVGLEATDVRFTIGLKWALRPVVGRIGLLQGRDSFQAYDYIVRFVADQANALPPSDVAWSKALADATDTQAFTIGVRAYNAANMLVAARAFDVASRSTDSRLARIGQYDLATTRARLGDHKGALAAFEHVWRQANDSSDHELVVEALLGKADALGKLGRWQEAKAVYDQTSTYLDDAAPEFHELVAQMLIERGRALSELDEQASALESFDRVIVSFGDAPELKLHEMVAMALLGKALTLDQQGMLEDALMAYLEVVARVSDADDPVVRGLVAEAQFGQGTVLDRLGRSKEAIVAYEQALARSAGQCPDQELCEQVAEVLLDEAGALSQYGEQKEAIALYEQVLACLDEASGPNIRELIAKALLGMADATCLLSGPVDAIAAYGRILVRFGDASEPELREVVAKALLGKAGLLSLIGELEEALGAYEQVPARFEYASEPKLRKHIFRATLGVGAIRLALSRPDDLESCEYLLQLVYMASERELREEVAKTLFGESASTSGAAQ